MAAVHTVRLKHSVILLHSYDQIKNILKKLNGGDAPL